MLDCTKQVLSFDDQGLTVLKQRRYSEAYVLTVVFSGKFRNFFRQKKRQLHHHRQRSKDTESVLGRAWRRDLMLQHLLLVTITSNALSY